MGNAHTTTQTKYISCKYTEFDFDYYATLPTNKQKEYLDSLPDLECETHAKWRPIHFICRYSTPEMIKYIISKGVDLECKTKGGWRPIHIVCRYSTPEIIKQIMDMNVDLKCATNDGWRPIDIICRYSTPEMANYAMQICNTTPQCMEYGGEWLILSVQDLMRDNPNMK
jgi:ankyrin repeat protein